jgi:hypothetical protein
LFLVELRGFGAFLDVCLEPPRVALRSLAPVPKTCPHSVVRNGHTDDRTQRGDVDMLATIANGPEAYRAAVDWSESLGRSWRRRR